MDLAIDYGRQSVLPQCFMKSIHQYQRGDEVQPKPIWADSTATQTLKADRGKKITRWSERALREEEGMGAEPFWILIAGETKRGR